MGVPPVMGEFKSMLVYFEDSSITDQIYSVLE